MVVYLGGRKLERWTLYMQDAMYEIRPSGDYLHVVCAKCREACGLDFKGRDPSMVLIEITCPKCGSSGKWKLWQAKAFPRRRGKLRRTNARSPNKRKRVAFTFSEELNANN
jgi:hypothetical protein